jgi:hypothetical protein
VDTGGAPSLEDSEAHEFWAELKDRTWAHNQVVISQWSGNLPQQRAMVLDMALEESGLSSTQEFLLFDPYRSKTPLTWPRAELLSTAPVLQIAPSGQPISDNYHEGMCGEVSISQTPEPVNANTFVEIGIDRQLSQNIFAALKTAGIIDSSGNVKPEKLKTMDLFEVFKGLNQFNSFTANQYGQIQKTLFAHLGGTTLFNNTPVSSGSVEAVKNQPGWFMLTVSNEVFLLAPTGGAKEADPPIYPTIAAGLDVGPPLLNPASFIMQYIPPSSGNKNSDPGKIDSNTSDLIYTALSEFQIIKDGRLQPGITQDMVKQALQTYIKAGKITEAQVPWIYNALSVPPIVEQEAFVGGKIDEILSATIFDNLQSFTMIDPNGRINTKLLTGANLLTALGTLLFAGKLTRSQINSVYQILVEHPRALSMDYRVSEQITENLPKLPDECNYQVIRLSTGAVQKVSRALFAGGVVMLLDLDTQNVPVKPVLPFDRFGPSPTKLIWPAALDAVQVDFDGLYGQYYWELFFHSPRLIACDLTANQQFQDAMLWLQYIFDPTVMEEFVTAQVLIAKDIGVSEADAAKIVDALKHHNIPPGNKPILNEQGRVNPDFIAPTDLSFLKQTVPTLQELQVTMIRNILLNYKLAAPASHYWRFFPFRTLTLQTLKEQLSDNNPAVKVYNDDPFDPFAIACLRPGAFEKATVMQYIDNLIKWGDMLFIQDTRESINAANMLYIYAYDLLGKKPQEVGECQGADRVLTFKQIKEAYPEGIPQFLIDLEHFIGKTGDGPDLTVQSHAFNDLDVYFCVPENSSFTGYWDIVQDRLYKIRHSQNIEGVFRQLPLFQPPINPLDLVKAAAAGGNAQATAQTKPDYCPYRFKTTLESARRLTATLTALGQELLGALEKKDAEALSAMQNSQAGQILDMTTQIKQERIKELEAGVAALTESKAGAQNRLDHYSGLIEKGISVYEEVHLVAMEEALIFNLLATVTKTASSIGYAVPQVGSPFAMTYGGKQIGAMLNAASGVLEIGSIISNFIGQCALTMGGYDRRSQDWKLQKTTAQHEVKALAQQLAGAQAQLEGAKQDLAVHNMSIAQNKAVAEFLSGKFTNEDLYGWLAGQISSVYYQTFALAIQEARWAQSAYQIETDRDDSFLNFDYWDSGRKGLLAGRGLELALDRMDASYRKLDTRRLEIEKTVSLAMIAPQALDDLKTKGSCQFSFTEALFDYDYPGHYLRKITSLSVSIPAVIGPYENIKAVLTQKNNTVVTETSIEAVNYLLRLQKDKPSAGLREDWQINQCIAVSRGVDDSGLFRLDFSDPRYLPFENTGAVSTWTLEMPKETNRFDFDQLSDVIITLRYTALADGGLEASVKNSLAKVPYQGGLYTDAPRMQPSAWETFLADHSKTDQQTLKLTINPDRLAYFKDMTYTKILVRLDAAEGVSIPEGAGFLSLEAGDAQKVDFKLSGGSGQSDALKWNAKTTPASWSLVFNLTDPDIKTLLDGGFIDGTKLTGLELIVLYEGQVF